MDTPSGLQTTPSETTKPKNGGLPTLLSRWKNWSPAALWMLLIFIGSSDLLSSRNTSGILNPLLRWFYPGISARAIASIHYSVRKAGHVSEYAILALLLWRAFPGGPDTRKPLWRRRKAALVLAVTIVYAGSDEFHQRFVPARTGAIGDVGWDSCGAVAGVVAAWAWSRRNARPGMPR